jgi:L-amino acid N-acyltransferase YncA
MSGKVMGVIVRRAEAPDAPAVAEIYAHYVANSAATFDESAPGADEMAAKIAGITAAGLPFLVAERDGAVSGFAYLARYHDRSAYRFTAQISVYVAAAARGGGLGRALMERLLADSAEAGVREVVAIIGVTGDPASIALHRAFGFEDAGLLRAVGFKHGRWYDTALMQLSLAPPPSQG